MTHDFEVTRETRCYVVLSAKRMLNDTFLYKEKIACAKH
jgi:hypothetical protein